MNLDVGFVEESSVTDVTVMHHLLPLITLTRGAAPSPTPRHTAGPEKTLKIKTFITEMIWNIRPTGETRSLMGGRRLYNEVSSLVG